MRRRIGYALAWVLATGVAVAVGISAVSTVGAQVRGRGLMLGIQLEFPGNQFVTACLERGFLVNCTVDTVLRFLPPLIVTESAVDLLVGTLDELFAKV